MAEQIANDDPYRFSLEPDREFLEYVYEQQALLVEGFVCCQALKPEVAKTDTLHTLLDPHFLGLVRDHTAGGVVRP